MYTRGRQERISATDEHPSEFFYGAIELARLGLEVEILQEADLGLDRSARSPLARLSDRGFARLSGISGRRLAALSRPSVLRRLASFDGIVTTANNYALEIGALRALHLLEARHLAFVMGLLPLGSSRLSRLRTGWALRRSTALAISRAEAIHLGRTLPSMDLRYAPFGVDDGFWRPGTEERPAGEPYAVSIGNDQHRDFGLLARAWSPDLPLLRIVTRLPVPTSAGRVVVHAGDWRDQVYTDAEIRALLQGAAFVVIPLRETIQPAGQSATLQAMACGKAVILTETSGLWDPAVMRHEATCLLVRPGDPESLASAARRLAADAALAERIGQAARKAVEENFTTRHMAGALESALGSTDPASR